MGDGGGRRTSSNPVAMGVERSRQSNRENRGDNSGTGADLAFPRKIQTRVAAANERDRAS